MAAEVKLNSYEVEFSSLVGWKGWSCIRRIQCRQYSSTVQMAVFNTTVMGNVGVMKTIVHYEHTILFCYEFVQSSNPGEPIKMFQEAQVNKSTICC